MDDLRVILLVAGVLFVAALVGYEWWRARGARPAALPPRDFEETPRNYESGSIEQDDEPGARASSMPLPEINVMREPRSTVDGTLPVIDISHAGQVEQREPGINVSGEVAVDRPTPAPQSTVPAPQSTVPAPLPPTMPTEVTSTQAILRSHDEPFIPEAADEKVGERVSHFDEVSEPRVVIPTPTEVDARGPQIVLQWPGEAERRIVTLRVLPRGDGRFAGRALRQAFASAGFWHGPLDIFHLPDADGRVILSAAALAQPGTFDPSIMDSQRFSGLNMFAVLPGPMPQRDAFEELVHAARQLAERLDGTITDQHGDELTSARIARLRQSLEEPPAARAAGES